MQNQTMQTELELRLKQIALPEQTTEDSILKLDSEVYAAHLLSQHGVILSELLDWHEENCQDQAVCADNCQSAADS